MTRIDALRPIPILLGLAVVYFAGEMLRLPASPVVVPDSASYLTFTGLRTLGYPVFLRIAGSHVMIAQVLLFTAALSFLAIETWRMTGSVLLGAILFLGIGLNPQIHDLNVTILTESLFMTLLILAIALAVRFIRRPDAETIAAASAIIGLVMTVRPSAWALAPLPLLLMLLRPSPKRLIAAAILPLVLIVGVERGVHARISGQSLAPRVLFGLAAMIESPARVDAPPVAAMIAGALNDDFAPVRALVRSAPSFDIEQKLSQSYEACAGFLCSEDVRRRTGVDEATFDRYASDVATARLKGAPLEYLKLVWTHYRSLWTLYSQTHPSLADGFRAFIAAHRPLPFEAMVPNLTDEFSTSRAALVVRPLFIAIGLLTAVLSLLAIPALWRGDASAPAAAALAAALAIQMSFVFTSLFIAGIPRSTIALWPAMVTEAIFAFAWLVSRFKQRAPAAATT